MSPTQPISIFHFLEDCFFQKVKTLMPLRSISFQANNLKPSLSGSFWSILLPTSLAKLIFGIEVPYCLATPLNDQYNHAWQLLSPYLLKLYLPTGNLWSEPVFEVICYHFGFVNLQARFLSWVHPISLPLSRMRRERRMYIFGAEFEF